MTENSYKRWLGTDNDLCLPVIDQHGDSDAPIAAKVHSFLR